MNYYLAIDIGASSGRHILGHLENGKIVLEEIFRFENKLVEKSGHLCWDIEHLYASILEGMKECKKLDKLPVSLGIDTWGVDYVLLDEKGELLTEPYAYRDGRTADMDELTAQILSREELYARTGIAQNIFNTIYQLVSCRQEMPETLKQAKTFLMIPDYFHYRLTGKVSNEYTNASTTGLLDAAAKDWDRELLTKLGIDPAMFCEISQPGTVLGSLLPEIAEQVGFDCRVVLPASHDTGSAFIAVPAQDDTSVYISSGTWSLLGVENDRPILSEAALKSSYTNEGGCGKYRFLRNIMGLWMLQNIRNELNRAYSFPEIADLARAAEDYHAIVDVNDNCFLAPESMISAIRDYCAAHGLQVPTDVGETAKCVYLSLAKCYADSIASLSELTGIRYTAINIVGGGSRDGYLNQLTANCAGIPVFAGPTEGTSLGNLLIQMIADGCVSDIPDARRIIRDSFDIITYQAE